jgi:hypothetical protein
MFRLGFAVSAYTYYFLKRYAPSNKIIAAVRTRDGLKWGAPAMLLAVPYLGLAYMCIQWIDNGGAGWLHILVFIGCFNTIKFLLLGPMSLLLLARCRLAEWWARSVRSRIARAAVG